MSKLLQISVFFAALFVTGAAFGQQYFPDHVLDRTDEESDFRAQWYGKDLKALNERSLFEISKPASTAQVYRFLWLRTFNHPIVVRLDIYANGTGTVSTKVSNGAGGYDPGKIIVNRTRNIPKEIVDSFLSELDDKKFWELPTFDPPPQNVVRLDGSQWVIEAVRCGRYKVIDRWSPKEGAIRDIGLTMAIDLAQLKLLYQEVY